MSGSGGGSGPSLIAMDAALRSLTGSDQAPHDGDQRAELDAEELREVEYATMGLPVPVRTTDKRPERSLLRRILGR